MNLYKVDVRTGEIIIDYYQNTNVDEIIVGDVQGKALITPVVIATGRRLANLPFGLEKTSYKLSYENIPTVAFS